MFCPLKSHFKCLHNHLPVKWNYFYNKCCKLVLLFWLTKESKYMTCCCEWMIWSGETSIVTTFVKKMEHIFILSSFLQVASTFRVTWCESSLMEPRIQSLSWNLHLMSSELSTCVLKTQMKINGEERTLVLFAGLARELAGWPACLLSTRNSNPCDLALSTPVSV